MQRPGTARPQSQWELPRAEERGAHWCCASSSRRSCRLPSSTGILFRARQISESSTPHLDPPQASTTALSTSICSLLRSFHAFPSSPKNACKTPNIANAGSLPTTFNGACPQAHQLLLCPRRVGKQRTNPVNCSMFWVAGRTKASADTGSRRRAIPAATWARPAVSTGGGWR